VRPPPLFFRSSDPHSPLHERPPSSQTHCSPPFTLIPFLSDVVCHRRNCLSGPYPPNYICLFMQQDLPLLLKPLREAFRPYSIPNRGYKSSEDSKCFSPPFLGSYLPQTLTESLFFGLLMGVGFVGPHPGFRSSLSPPAFLNSLISQVQISGRMSPSLPLRRRCGFL